MVISIAMFWRGKMPPTDHELEEQVFEVAELPGFPNCPVSLYVSKCPSGEPLWEPQEVLPDVGETMALTIQWIEPDNWLARVSQWLAMLLYRIGIDWGSCWGRWRQVYLKTEARIVVKNEAGTQLRTINPAVRSEGRMGTFAEMEKWDDAN